MTATVQAGLPAAGRHLPRTTPYVSSYTRAEAESRAYGRGPRTRVQPVGDADEATVRTALTAAWRAAGQPLTVVVLAHGGRVDQVAAAWATEHAVAGIRLEVRHTVEAASSPAQLLQLGQPPQVVEGCPACGRPA